MLKVEVGESGVDFQNFRVEVGVEVGESTSKNLESKSESGVDIQLIDIKRY